MDRGPVMDAVKQLCENIAGTPAGTPRPLPGNDRPADFAGHSPACGVRPADAAWPADCGDR